jgi:hypothetical protein
MHPVELAMKKATKLRILRRPDGVIELRRRRLRDSAEVRGAALLACLCLICIGFIAAIAAMLVETPLVLAGAGALVLPFVPAVLLARDAELGTATVRARRQGGPSPAGPPDGAA